MEHDDQRQLKHEAALARNEWVRVNYAEEADVRGEEIDRLTPGKALVVIFLIVALLWSLIGYGIYVALS